MFHPEAPLAIRALLAVHIAAGTIALFVVPVAMAVRKGGRAHRRAGLAFVYAMFVVAATALVCAPYFHDDFFLLIAVFSSYLAFAGWRTLARKRPATTPAATADWIGASLAFAAGAGMIALGLVRHAMYGDFTIVLVVLGAICAGAGIRSAMRFVRPPADTNAWLFEHFGMMLAAYIATVTAFSAVNFHFIHPVWLRWLWPTVVGTIVIASTTARYKAKVAKGATLRQLVTVRETIA